MEPIGIRQNNPGNIRYGAGFAGEEEGERGFGRYPDPESGGRALIGNLAAYDRKHGLNTVSGIISRWAPTNENDTAAYINVVASHLGVAPDAPLDMQDPGTLAKLGAAISKQEGNGRLYTAQFFEALVGTPASRSSALDVYAASEGLPAFTKQQMRSASYHADPNAPGEPDLKSVDDMSMVDRVWKNSALYEQAAELQGADEAAMTTRWAGVGETIAHAWEDTVTGALIERFKRGEYDPDFKIGDAQFEQMGQAGILPVQSLVDYVKGARNQEDFKRRMEIAIERKDFYERAANTSGLAGAVNTVANFATTMGDPLAVAASMGLGAAVSSARAAGAAAAAKAASRAATEARTAARSAELRIKTVDQIESGRASPNLGRVLEEEARTLGKTKDAIAATRAEAAAYTAVSEARLGSIKYAAGSGAVENIAAGEFVRQTNNQEFSFGDMMFQGLFGAGMGTLGGILAKRAARGERAAEKMADEAAANLEGTLQSLIDSAHEHGVTGRPIEDGTWSTEIADFPVQPVLSGYAGDVPAVRTQVAQAISDLMGNPREPVFSALPETATGKVAQPGKRPVPPAERVGSQQAGTSAVGEGRVPNVRRIYTGGEGNQIARFSRGETGSHFAEIQHARYQEFKKSELIEEVHAEELEGLPDNAKAVYVPADGKVYVVRSRLTPAEAADPTGLIAHEIGVHYGLERTLGSTKYANVLGEVERLARTDARVREALQAVPKDTPANLVLEEALGYFVEKNTKMGPLARIMASIRSWLREYIPLFKNLGMTSNELIRMVQGSVQAARKADVRAAEGVARFSRTTEGQATADVQRVQLRMTKVEQDLKRSVDAWDETIAPEGRAQQRRLRKWYDETRARAVKDGIKPWIDSPGLMLAMSKSKTARYLGAHLFESATGMGKRISTVAIEYERMQLGYKHMAIPRLQELLVQGLTNKERVQYMVGGAKAAEDRVWRAVEVERQQHRNALRAAAKYESTAPEYIQQAAKVLDDFYDKVTQDGKLAGNPLAEKVRGPGFVGHLPYEWQWEKISKAYREDPARFKAFFDNLTQQYTEIIVDPAMDAMADVGPVHPEQAAALRMHMIEKVSAVVDNKIRAIMADPQSRLDGMEQRFELIAADLLKEDFAGAQVTPEVIQAFKEKLGDIRQDRTRRELDLLREVNGVSLLDFIKYNAISQVTYGAHRWAGLNALARKGFIDLADAQAARNIAAFDGATPEEIKAIDFGFRAFGLGQINNAERAAFSTVRNFTYSATMGKLGFAQAADAVNVVSAVGIRGLLQFAGLALSRNTELMKQLAIDAPGLLGQDYRLNSLTPDVSATGRMMIGEGSLANRVSQRAAQGVSYVSGANFVNKMLHKAFLPIFAEDVLRTIRGKNGGMSLERMVDLGLDSDAMARIRTQLDKYDAGRKRGGRIHWDQWDDQGAADDLLNAMHRGTYQVFQRALVGEQPMWMTDSKIGSIVGQFRRFGMIAAEKQTMRNIAIGDSNAANAFVLGATWGALLYYARLQASTLGMSEQDREKYLEDNTKGWRLASGIMNHMNASGIMPEFVQAAEALLGGTSFRQRGAPIAAMGFIGNVMGAGNQLGSYLTGQSEGSEQLTRSLFRIAPGGNSIIGAYLMNEMTSD